MLQLSSLLMIILLIVSCSPIMHHTVASAKNLSSSAWFSPCSDGSTAKFQTGFEGQSQVISKPTSQRARFAGSAGIDTCEKKNQNLSTQGPVFGRADIQFEGGTSEDRKAQVISDPNKSGNNVLHFWLQKPNVMGNDRQPLKGRVQMNLYDNKNVKQVKMTVRMYLHPDFNYLRSYSDKMDWLTISEWWNNAGWTHESFPFRISVNIVKENPGKSSPLVFAVHAQTSSSNKSANTKKKRWDREKVWEKINRDFAIPIGQWVTLEYGFVEGDSQNGRFFLAATAEGGKRTVIFDIKGYTYHPDDPNPDGLSHLNPLKLYTSSQVIEYVRSQGGALQILWDDLQLTACSASESVKDGACAIR